MGALRGTTTKQLARKVAALDRKVRQNRGEQKIKQISAQGTLFPNNSILQFELTSISSGDGIADRDGFQISVDSIRVRGHSSSNKVDWYLIQVVNDSILIYSDFAGVIGGGIDSNHKHEFKELKYFRSFNTTSGNVQTFHKFKFPLTVSYNATSATPVRNRIFLVLKNNTGAQVSNYDYFAEMLYRDK